MKRYRPSKRGATLIVFPVAAAAAFALWGVIVRPSTDRDWIREHARLPVIREDGDRVDIDGVRNFRYVSSDSVRVDYDERSYDLDAIESLWLCISIFDEARRRGPAHTMLSFGFAGGDYVVISVEARKEIGEGYSPYLGVLKRYEIIYVIGDERDLVQTRAVHRSDDVYLYPVRASKEKIGELFRDMLRAADALHTRPEFYNTLTNNCTTTLRDHVNRIAPDRIPASWTMILPGYADEFLERQGLLESRGGLEPSRRHFRINDLAERAAGSDDFSHAIRERIRAR